MLNVQIRRVVDLSLDDGSSVYCKIGLEYAPPDTLKDLQTRYVLKTSSEKVEKTGVRWHSKDATFTRMAPSISKSVLVIKLKQRRTFGGARNLGFVALKLNVVNATT